MIHAVSAIAPQFWNGTARLGELKAVADVQHVKLGASQSKRDRYAEAIGTANSPVSTLLPLLAAAEEEVTVAEKALAATRAEIADLDADSDTVFADIVKAVQNVDSIEARAALREDLSRVLLKCVVDSSAGTLAVYVRGEDVPITVPLRLDAVLPGIQMETMSTKEYEDYLRSEEPQ